MITHWQVLFRLIVAAVLSGFIGFEREFHGRAAGFRTHILLCLGSTLVMLTSIHMVDAFSGKVIGDPGRIAAGVVTGIGFLGAGTIMRSRASVRGLTTATSLWVVSGIGLAVGSGMYFAASVTTALTLVALLVFSRMEHALIRKDWYRVLEVESQIDADNLSRVREVLARYEAEIKDFEVEKDGTGPSAALRISIRLATSRHDDEIIREVKGIAGVKHVKWEVAV